VKRLTLCFGVLAAVAALLVPASSATNGVTMISPLNKAVYLVNASNVVAAANVAPADGTVCTIAWSDGKFSSAPVNNGTCAASHQYTAVGTYTITVSAGVGSDQRTILVISK
jgi:hypothetical protein